MKYGCRGGNDTQILQERARALAGTVGKFRRDGGSTTGHGGERTARFLPHRPDGLGRYRHWRAPYGLGPAKANLAVNACCRTEFHVMVDAEIAETPIPALVCTRPGHF